MKIQRLIINIFNRKYLRWILILLFTLMSFIKFKLRIRYSYNNDKNLWLQSMDGFIFFVDEEPNWNLNIRSLEKLVEEFSFVYYKPSLGDTIIDVGAGVGTDTIIYSKSVGDEGKVFAFEAFPETFNKLSLLKDINKLANLSLHNMAVSCDNNTLYITSNENHASNSISTENNNGISVKATSIDAFVDKMQLQEINFLKMNIEGGEVNAIKGMKKTIKKIHHISISCHDFLYDNNNKIKGEMTQFLESNGFKVFTRNSGHMIYDSWIFGVNQKV